MPQQRTPIARQVIGLGTAVAGGGCLIAAGFLVNVPVGLFVAGVCLVYFARSIAE